MKTISPTLLAGVLGLAAPALGQTSADVQVDAGSVVRVVDDRQSALNTAIWDGYYSSPQNLPLVSALDVRALRFPGGSVSDDYHWQTNSAPDSYAAIDFDTFAAFARSLPAQMMITANYGTGTPDEAAAWVQYANVTQGYGVKYWEIGNEVYGSWETDQQSVPHDPVVYATRARQYIQEMKAADPTIRVGVVVITGEDSYPSGHTVTNPATGDSHSGWTPVMLSTLKSLGVTPDFVIYHRYEQNAGQENDASLLQAARTWTNDAADLRGQLTDYLGAAGAGVELLVTENNSISSQPGRQSVSLVNGLYLADSVGNLLQTEFNSLFWWDLRNGQETDGNLSTSLYGWRDYGDYGLMSGVAALYPTYYVTKLLSRFARGGDAVVSATSSSSLLSVYAAHRGDGSLSLLVINKSPAAAIDGQFALSGFTPSGTGTQYSYGIPQDNAAAAGDTGADADVQASPCSVAGPSFSQSFGPYSVTLLSLAPAQTPTLAGARLVNISSRGYVDGTAHLLTAGFVIGGTGTEQVLIRGVGPTLANFGVGSPVADPLLQVFDAGNNNQLIASNDNWSSGSSQQTSQFQTTFSEVGAFGLPVGSLDAALLLTLPPGRYTAELSGNGGSSGDGLVEVYEVPPGDGAAPTARLVNISSRGYVDSGAHIMTDGFIVSGTGPEQVLIRGVGPTLANYGVTSCAADPALRVFDQAQQTIGANDDWDGAADLASAFSSVFAFSLPPLSRDAATRLTLQPGLYTAEVSGTNGPAGDALAEVYEVPPP